MTNPDILTGIGQQPGLPVDTENLNLVVIPTAYQQVVAVGRDHEVTGMFRGELIPYPRKRTLLLVDGENGNSISLKAVGSVQEPTIGGYVDISAPACAEGIGLDHLLLSERPAMIIEDDHLARQFTQQVQVASPIRVKVKMARPGPGWHSPLGIAAFSQGRLPSNGVSFTSNR